MAFQLPDNIPTQGGHFICKPNCISTLNRSLRSSRIWEGGGLHKVQLKTYKTCHLLQSHYYSTNRTNHKVEAPSIPLHAKGIQKWCCAHGGVNSMVWDTIKQRLDSCHLYFVSHCCTQQRGVASVPWQLEICIERICSPNNVKCVGENMLNTCSLKETTLPKLEWLFIEPTTELRKLPPVTLQCTHLITIPMESAGRSRQTPMKSWMFSCLMRQSVLTSETNKSTSSFDCRAQLYIHTCPCQ